MKIVIVGAGQVGTHVAKMLSREDHDITLVDEDKLKTDAIDGECDVFTVQGTPTSLKTLEDAGTATADLFIGVTPNESQNITACVLAHELGAKKTLARINNYEYLLPENQTLFRKLGIDVMIYPELLAAKEIAASIKVNWVRQWMEFSGGELTLIGMKVRDNAPIINQRLMDLKDSEFYRVVAIGRNSSTIIPKGSDQILANDIVYFITTKDFIPDVRTQAGKEVIDVKNMMVMGAENITKRTIRRLPDDIFVKIIDKDMEKIKKLMNNAMERPQTMLVNIDASDLESLKDENIQGMDAFVALSDNSEANILACIAAKRFGLKKTIAEVENIDYIPLAESLDIGTIINKKLLAASYIFQYTLDADVRNVKSLTHADTEVVELTPKENAYITKGKIMDLKLPKDIFIGGYIRDGKGYIANGSTQILPGDSAIVFCLSSNVHKLDKLFS